MFNRTPLTHTLLAGRFEWHSAEAMRMCCKFSKNALFDPTRQVDRSTPSCSELWIYSLDLESESRVGIQSLDYFRIAFLQ